MPKVKVREKLVKERLSEQDICKIIIPAKEFHGHLGPFLVIGIRMGLIGLRELDVVKGAKNLNVTAYLAYKVPVSCILDGLQLATSCTLGNTRLKIKKSKKTYVSFKIQNGKKVIVIIKPETYRKIMKELSSKKLNVNKIEDMSYKIALQPENDIFIISKQKSTD